MTQSALRIIFAGTPEFAAIALQKILSSAYSICGVYTQPDRPAGRGQKYQASPVKKIAEQYQLPLYQPITLRDPIEQQKLRALHADLIIVAAYGLILPLPVLTAPRLGCINIHASLLPRWRGAAPIQHAILAGDQETGITIMQMDEGLDTGPMLYRAVCPLHATDTSQTLHDRLATLGAETIVKVIAELEQHSLPSIPQDESQACYAPKITKTQAHIDWQLPAIQIDRSVRAFNPWPVAFTYCHNVPLRVWETRVVTDVNTTAKPGTILDVQKTGIDIATGDGVLRLLKIQLPSGKPLSVSEVLNAKQALFTPGTSLQ